MFELHTTEVCRVPQSVIAPAFLLAGMGTFINVMTQRLTKVVDQAREFAIDESDDDPTPEATNVVALMTLISALLTFLFEIFLATKVLRGDYLRTGMRPRRKAT